MGRVEASATVVDSVIGAEGRVQSGVHLESAAVPEVDA
jgi:hypothetical protein